MSDRRRLAELYATRSPRELAAAGAMRSGMGEAASLVGADGSGGAREELARSIAARAAEASGVTGAAESVGAAPGQGRIAARRQELMSQGLSAMEAMQQMAREGLVNPRLAALLMRAPGAVPQY